ncbi:hypothetical protein JHC09_06355 [Devosia sp. MC532]|uniref:hypothetical protein n=1 Tax=Devosia sp. MC532 TaxID=2799788 RepID=UPI0018F637F6|nr:hypothetical protein [Devosia sp. MC532]MBJ7577503.1 hypothetical protein [Devosia sp. MC532]
MHSAPSAVTLTVILAVFSLFQLALILGAPLGQYVFGGQNKRLEGGQRILSLIAIVVSAAVSYAALTTVGVFSEEIHSTYVPDTGLVVAMWGFAAVVLYFMLTKLNSKSKAERTVMAPLSAVVLGLVSVVAFGL